MVEENTDKAWCVASQLGANVRELAAALGVPELLARALINRGVREPCDAEKFLNPSSLHLEDPFAFKDMGRAVERVLAALKDGQKILIQGDYDVDGSASAALLVNLFRLLGADVEASIPSRSEDGYGLSERVVRDAAARGVKLLITCDNGTTACKEVACANSLGIDVVITDHHTVGDELPAALALMNPHVKGESVAFRDLCGAGVAFKFAWAILQKASQGARLDANFRDFLQGAQSLVALAAVADVVPLRGENRVLCRYGLRLLPESPNPGLRALMEVAGLTRAPSGSDVAFKLAPRLNAGGRMGRESLAVELLTSGSYGDALRLAQEADSANKKRQTLDRELTRLARELVLADPGYENERVLVLGHEGFNAGLVGIVAARLTETFNKPAVLVALNGEAGRGSGRSIPGFHLYNALNDCAHLMRRFGGHEQAAGLEISTANMGLLRRSINEVADKHVMNADYRTPTLDIDAETNLAELDVSTVERLSQFEPFGEGNPEPVFMARGVELSSAPRVVGRGQGHLSLLVKQGGPALKAIGFGMGPQATGLARGSRVKLAFTPRISDFRGSREVEIEIKDLRPE
ncbi:MAG: single-stranded-DNA-specific exonuclease RecJ [Planctomycetes bacterium]|nr:single-stranded-DNA-specific exonuclease RecJ [Planctomycetota bacterium]